MHHIKKMKGKRRRRRKTLFSSQNASLLRRQPEGMTIGHGPKEIGNILNPSDRCLFQQAALHILLQSDD